MKNSLLVAGILLTAAFSQANMISIQCGGSTAHAKLAFSSMTTEPTRADLENLALDYKGEEINLTQVKTIKSDDQGQITGYQMIQEPNYSGNDIPHLEFDFKNLQNCGNAEAKSKVEVNILSVGGFVGLLPIETIKNCTCDVD